MKKYILAIILFSAIGFASAQTPNTWISKSSFGGTARSYATGFSIGNKGYIGLGYDGTHKEDFWEYDPATDVWSQKSNFGGGPRAGAVGFSIGNKGYVGTGYHTSYNNDFWEYNPVNNTWAQKNNFGGSGRNLAVGFCIGNKGYIGTGQTASAYLNDFWEYNPSLDSWTQKLPFAGAGRFAAVGFGIGSKGYLGTGWTSGASQDFWEYDPGSDTWLQKANFGGGSREYASGFSIFNKGYIGVGYQSGLPCNDFWEYDPGTNTWMQKATLGSANEKRYISVGFSIANKGYIGTGTNAVNLFQDFWEYTPSNNIITNAISDYDYCPGDVFNLSYTVTGTFGITNIFTAQLSDAAGSFTNPVVIGNTSNTSGGVINATIPSNTSPGVGYRIRIISSDPVLYSNDNGSNITIFASPTASAYSNAPICTGTTLDLFSNGGVDYYWTGPGFSSLLQNPSITTVTSANEGTYNVTVSEIHNGNVWTPKASLSNSSRFRAVGFSIGDKGYFGTGYNGTTVLNDFWEYNPLTDAWTQKASFPGSARLDATGFCIGNKGYIGLGADGSILFTDFWEYNPSMNTWTPKTNFGGIARIRAVGFGIGAKGYIGTGESATNYLNDFWEYDQLTNVWVQKANFAGPPRSTGVGFSIGSKGYLGTGWNGSTHHKDFWEYNPGSDTWVQKAFYGGIGREYAAAFSIGDKGYIGTGADTYLKDFWEYNSLTDIWTKRADFGGSARYGSFGFAIGSKGYIGGGNASGSIMNDFWEYYPPDNVCSSNASTFVTINSSPTIIIASQTAASCPSSLDGTIDLDAVGGTPSYLFTVNQTSTSDGVFTNLTPGIYTAIVTDDNGCTGTLSITINSTTPPLICSDASVSTTICPGTPFTVTAHYSGGIGPYSYSWNDGGAGGGPYGNTQSVSAILPVGHYTYSCTITDACGQTCTSTVEFKICATFTGNFATLNLKFFIQGYYIGGGEMTPVLNNQAAIAGNTYPNITDVDTVNIELHDPSFPNALIDCATGIVDIYGNCSVTFPSFVIGQSYYVSICNRNILQTTTANPVAFSSVTTYNFTTAANKAFGSAMIDVGTPLGESPTWAFYIGDLNHNCLLDGIDMNLLIDDLVNGAYGSFASDLNGDGFVDASDYIILDQNVQFSPISGVNWCCECTSVICVSLINCPDTCHMDTLFINTGIDRTTNLPLDSLREDRFWKLISTPSGTLSTPQNAWTLKPNAGWHAPLENEFGSDWIGNTPSANEFSPAGNYVYEFYFCLHDTAGLSLDLSFLADNTGIVKLNGAQILASINGPGGNTGFNNPASTIVNGTFIPNSKNVLRVEIQNSGGASGFNIAGKIISANGSVAYPGCCCSDSIPIVQCGQDITICYSDNTVYFVTPAVTVDSCCLPVTISNDAPTVFPVGTTAVTWTATDACGRIGTCVQNVTKKPSLNIQVNLPMTVCIGKLRSVSFSIGGTTGSTYSWSINPGNVTGTIDANTGMNTFPLFGAGSYTLIVGDGNVFGCSESITFNIAEIYCLDTCNLDTLFINTGIEHETNTNLSIPQQDRFWKVISTPAGSPSFPGDAWTISRYPGWHLPLQNEHGSEWIGSSSTANNTTAAGDYVFEFYFCLKDTDGLSLDLGFLADNRGIVKLNGIQILQTITSSSGDDGFINPASTIVNGIFIPNTRNVIRVEIHNDGGPSGFNIAGRIISSSGSIGFPGCCCSNSNPIVQCGQNISICYSTDVVYFVTPTVTSDTCCTPVTLSNNAPTHFPVGTTPVTWTTIDACGREGTCVQNVTKSPSLITQVTHPNVCMGALGYVYFTVGGTTGSTYSWSINPGNVTGTSGANSPVSTDQIFGAGTYTLIVGDGNIFGCSESITFSIFDYCGDTCNLDTLFINTGIEHLNNTTLGIPQQDRFWKLISTPSGILTTPQDAWTIPREAGWHYPLQNSYSSNWIGNSSTATLDAPAGDYAYEFYFCLHDTDGLSLDLTFLADNRGIVKLNGAQILQTITSSSGDDGFINPASTIVRGTFIPNSRNIIRVEIHNDLGPSGFNIVGRIISNFGSIGFPGCCCEPNIGVRIYCPSDIIVCYNPPYFTLTPAVAATDSCCMPVVITNNAPAYFPIGITTVRWTATDACGNSKSCTQLVKRRFPFFHNCGGVVFDGKMYLEGYYIGNGTMNACLNLNGISGFLPNVYSPTDADSITISMIDPITFNEVDREIGILQANGDVEVTFSPAVVDGNSYYIKINHRNSIETWSSFPVLMSPITSYDFSINQSQAYGNNMIDVGAPLGEPSLWAIFSGDISNAGTATVGSQDGIIESQDYGDMENAVYFTLLGYSFEDITGDGVVESADYGLMENNVYYTRVIMRP